MICHISYSIWAVNVKRNHLTSAQIRAARALLRWRAEDLARASAVGVATIRRAELTERETSMTAPNDMAIRHALEIAGVEFIDGNGGGPGVRLTKAAAADSAEPAGASRPKGGAKAVRSRTAKTAEKKR
jgi:transcriptional regulator with XRE-family HTH domain